MPSQAQGETRIFLYTEQHQLITFVLKDQQLLEEDAIRGCVYFYEARNYCRVPQFYENCLVGFLKDGIGRLGITYYIDYKPKVAHVWMLKTGMGLDCSC